LKPVTRVNWWHNKIVQKDLGEKKFKAISIRDDRQLKRWTESFEGANVDYFAQSLIDGPESNIFSYHSFFDNALCPLATFVGRKIRTAPVRNGRSSFLSVVRNEQLEELGQLIVRRAKIRGPCKIDFKYDEAAKRFYLLEINPRYNLWHYLGASNGVNIPAVAYSYYQGTKELSKLSLSSTNIRWLDFRTDRKAFLEMRKSGEISLFGWLWSLRGQKVFNVFSWGDPLPFFHNMSNRMLNKAQRIASKVFR
jgi:predicted ATP-grasp superfamily ATP-dependent carboligase